MLTRSHQLSLMLPTPAEPELPMQLTAVTPFGAQHRQAEPKGSARSAGVPSVARAHGAAASRAPASQGQ